MYKSSRSEVSRFRWAALAGLLAVVGCGTIEGDGSGSGGSGSGSGSSGSGGNSGTGGNNSTGGSSGTTSGTGGGANGLREYGSGDHAVTLSDPNPGIYCWITQETVRICGGSRNTDWGHYCFDGERNCQAREPADSEREDGTCWTGIYYSIVGDGPLTGSCAKREAYMREDPDVECLYNAHCAGAGDVQGKCVDWKCVCPTGVLCGRAALTTPAGTAGASGAGGASGAAGASGAGGSGAPPAPPSPPGV